MVVSRKDKAADARLRREYHITLEEYKRVLKYQNNACAICKRPVTEFKTRLAVEHCHTSGLLRGLACWTCNKALAMFKDDAARMKSAYEYITNPPFTAVFKAPRLTAPGRVGTKKRAKLLSVLKMSTVVLKSKTGE